MFMQKKSRLSGSLRSLQGIKIHFREFLYNLCAKRNKRSGCLRRFGGPNKEMHSISRADKLCRSNGVGMSEAIDLAVAEAEPPTGGEA
jgi:hypothetical protein